MSRIPIKICKNGHEFSEENTYIMRRKEGNTRGCRECMRISSRRNYPKYKEKVAIRAKYNYQKKKLLNVVITTPSKRCWFNMKQRCENNKHNSYFYYGGRGIKVCEKWKKFEGFLEDMGEKPDGLSLDRIDVNGNYCKENCRWATLKEQARNKRSNVCFKGECVTDASLRLGGSSTLVTQRIKNGWSVEKAFTTIGLKRLTKKL